MQKARHSDNSGRSPEPSSDYLSDARGLDSGAGRQSSPRQGIEGDQIKEETDRLIACLLVQKKVLSATGRLSIAFLVKLADNIVSVREWLRDESKPVLHNAILLTLIDFFGGIHDASVSDAAKFVEQMICDDIEFRILNK